MLFNSFVFYLFLALVLPVFYWLPTRKYRNLFLLVSSYIFYGYWDWRFCLLIALSTLVDFTVAKLIDRSVEERNRKILLFVSLATNLGILAVFKYFGFFVDNLNVLLGSFNLGPLDYLHANILLPVGISFYTFQTLSYTIDVYRKEIRAVDSLLDFGLFVAFFPQLVAGPIERAKSLLPQISRKNNPTPVSYTHLTLPTTPYV